MKPRVLIVAGAHDPHVKAVTRHLDERGVEWKCVNVAALPEAPLSYDPGAGSLAYGGQELGGFTTVWSRRSYDPHLPTVPEEYQEFARQEFRLLFHGALLGMEPHWVSHPLAVRLATSKPYQLRIAARQGHFRIPDTLVTSDPGAARAFLRRHNGEAVAKAIGKPLVRRSREPTMVFTSRVTEAAMERLDGLRFGPCILQQFIHKAWEVRATVVANQVFAARMDTAGVEGAEVDWRVAPDFDAIAHSPAEPPEHVRRGCVEMCREFGLRFGAFDFVVDAAGDWYFLEVNPNGQWAWLEDLAGLPISRALADELCRRPARVPRRSTRVAG